MSLFWGIGCNDAGENVESGLRVGENMAEGSPARKMWSHSLFVLAPAPSQSRA